MSDELGLLASPAGVVTRRAGKRPPIAELLRRAEALGVEAIVFGLPINGEGDETDRSREVRDVAARLAARTSCPVRLVDERFTTAAALRTVREQGGSTRGRKGDVDALAAAILLEQVLQAERGGVTLGESVPQSTVPQSTVPQSTAPTVPLPTAPLPAEPLSTEPSAE